jgi:protein phosphatase
MGLWLLADGIASRGKGAVASSLALGTIAAEVRRGLDAGEANPPAREPEDRVKLLVSACAAAHLRLLDASRDEAPRAAMGTTVVALSLQESEAVLIHLGDSRCYSYSRGSAVQITTDHNIGTMLRSPNLSEAARQTMQGLNPRAITKALGCGNLAPPRPSVVRLNPRCSELLVLTSDGVHDPLGAQGIARVLDSTGGTLLARAQALVEAAVAAGGKDNATAVLVRPPVGANQRASLGTTVRL